MDVVGYIRVSTDGQCGEDKFGLESQKQSIMQYCSEHGMKIVQWYMDEGESGAKERPGFDEIIYGEVSNPPYEAVVVAKSDRVARDINIYYYYKMMLKKKDMQLISIAEDFGQFGVFASMLEAFTLCVAEMERENITKRMSGGRRVKASKGGYSGGSVPYGYKLVEGTWVVDEHEAENVRWIFKSRDERKTLDWIASELNARGEMTHRGNIFRTSTIQTIVANERTYRGEYKYGDGDWVKGQHEPILK